jgi:hypothetical protein
MSDLAIALTPGYTFSDDETLTCAKLNLLGRPSVGLSGSVGSTAIADNSVSTAKLQDDAVTADKLKDDATGATGAVTSDHIRTGAVVTAKIADEQVTYAKIQHVSATDKVLGRASTGAGDVEEVVCTTFGRSLIDDANAAAARATLGIALQCQTAVGSTGVDADELTPLDGTVPQNTEVDLDPQLQVTITPINASSKLVIEVDAVATPDSTGMTLVVALFQDAIADALRARAQTIGTGEYGHIGLRHVVDAGSVAARTYKVGFGVSVDTWVIHVGKNGSTKMLGAATGSTLVVTEVLNP